MSAPIWSRSASTAASRRRGARLGLSPNRASTAFEMAPLTWPSRSSRSASPVGCRAVQLTGHPLIFADVLGNKLGRRQLFFDPLHDEGFHRFTRYRAPELFAVYVRVYQRMSQIGSAHVSPPVTLEYRL